MTRQERQVESARKRVTKAYRELAAAGKALLVALKATDEEKADAAGLIYDLQADDRDAYRIDSDDAGWNALLAEEIECTREDEAEEAQSVADELHTQSTSAGDVPDVKAVRS